MACRAPLLLLCLAVPATHAFARTALHLQRLPLRPTISTPPIPAASTILSAATAVPASKPMPFLRRAMRAVTTAVLATLAPLPLLAASTATVGSVPFLARFMYGTKQLLLKNAPFAVLAFTVLTVLFGGLLFKMVEGNDLGDGTFRAYSLLINVPGADATADETPLGKLVSNGLFMLGVATFAVVIGIVSDGISSQIESLRLSNERVQETRHTVLLNWGAYSRPMLRQLEAARLEGRLSGSVCSTSPQASCSRRPRSLVLDPPCL